MIGTRSRTSRPPRRRRTPAKRDLSRAASSRRAGARRASDRWRVRFTLNGRRVRAEVPPTRTLLDLLRLDYRLTGTKGACLEGECGSCYVLVDGRPMNACLMLAPQVEGRAVTTIEGFADGPNLDILQQKFVECGAVQCGYCTPGLIVAARALLRHCPNPTREDVLVALEGNICRCTGYNTIVQAVEEAVAARRLPK